MVLYFIWLPSPELAIQRVAKRVREGGHNIPEAVVRRRYARGLANLFDLKIPIVDTLHDSVAAAIETADRKFGLLPNQWCSLADELRPD